MTPLLVLLGALIAKPVPTPVAHFSLTVTPLEEGYRLDCASGCSWLNSSFSCPAACNVVVDNNGVHVGPRPTPSPDAAFAFEFHEKRHGWELVRLTGSHWEKLGWWSNDGPPQAARVDESGVRSANSD